MHRKSAEAEGPMRVEAASPRRPIALEWQNNASVILC